MCECTLTENMTNREKSKENKNHLPHQHECHSFCESRKKKKKEPEILRVVLLCLVGGGGAEGGVCFWFTEWEKREKTFFKFL